MSTYGYVVHRYAAHANPNQEYGNSHAESLPSSTRRRNGRFFPVLSPEAKG
jgi:hypothetical protein